MTWERCAGREFRMLSEASTDLFSSLKLAQVIRRLTKANLGPYPQTFTLKEAILSKRLKGWIRNKNFLILKCYWWNFSFQVYCLISSWHNTVSATMCRDTFGFTHIQGENQQLCLGDGCTVCFSQLFTSQHHEKCQEWPNKHKLVKSTLCLALVWERDGIKIHTEDTRSHIGNVSHRVRTRLPVVWLFSNINTDQTSLPVWSRWS